jgi:hypothetical protein
MHNHGESHTESWEGQDQIFRTQSIPQIRESPMIGQAGKFRHSKKNGRQCRPSFQIPVHGDSEIDPVLRAPDPGFIDESRLI